MSVLRVRALRDTAQTQVFWVDHVLMICVAHYWLRDGNTLFSENLNPFCGRLCFESVLECAGQRVIGHIAQRLAPKGFNSR